MDLDTFITLARKRLSKIRTEPGITCSAAATKLQAALRQDGVTIAGVWVSGNEMNQGGASVVLNNQGSYQEVRF